MMHKRSWSMTTKANSLTVGQSFLVGGGAVLLTALAYTLVKPDIFVPQDVVIANYKFQVFCPINKITNKTSLVQILNEMKSANTTAAGESFIRSHLSTFQKVVDQRTTANDSEQIDRYVIYMQLRKANPANPYGQFFYCGYARQWEEDDCSNAKPICSSPGPMFYLPKDKAVDVAWVYNIQTDKGVGLNPATVKEFDSCYFPFPNSHHMCDVYAKEATHQECTYLDPLDFGHPSVYESKIDVTNQNILFTVHIHGLEVRPVFDGNPTSFMAKDGKVGIGYQSLDNEEYFSLFAGHKPTKFKLQQTKSLYAKINRYENKQSPGNLWYHDHSMHATYPNIEYGMAGQYIIYDKQMEKDLPSKKYDVFLLTPTSYSDTNLNLFGDQSVKTTPPSHGAKHGPHLIPINRKDVTFYTQSSLQFQRNQTYRIRILNAHGEAVFQNMMFLTNCDFAHSLTDNNLSDCKTQLKFSIIASDSTLYNKPIHNSNNVSMISGERYQILIVFDGQQNGQAINPISKDQNYVYFVTAIRNKDMIFPFFDIRKRFTLKPNQKPNKAKFPTEITTLNTQPFFDLNEINKPCEAGFDASAVTISKCIVATRFRPLLRDQEYQMSINGHFRFHLDGKSDYVKIGTTQDWYFINTNVLYNIPHPMHVHLVVFQKIDMGELKFMTARIPSQTPFTQEEVCSYYEIDFFVAAGVIPRQEDYLKMCVAVRRLNFNHASYIQNMNKAFLEDKETSPGIYGFDMLTKMTDQDVQAKKYFSQQCPDSTNRYYCNASLPIAPEDRQWKQTVKVPYATFVRIRIRWADASYNPDVKPYPFFHIPEDHLIEFPGYVYHCHFSHHEDNEMMRPFVVKPSPFFKAHYALTKGSPYEVCMQGKDNDWENLYKCINKIQECPLL